MSHKLLSSLRILRNLLLSIKTVTTNGSVMLGILSNFSLPWNPGMGPSFFDFPSIINNFEEFSTKFFSSSSFFLDGPPLKEET